MTRSLRTKRVDRLQAGTYLAKARQFRRDAESMADLAGEFGGNTVAVVCVHAAIAYADAVTIRARSEKSASGDHTDAADLLASAVRLLGAAEDTLELPVTAIKPFRFHAFWKPVVGLRTLQELAMDRLRGLA